MSWCDIIGPPFFCLYEYLIYEKSVLVIWLRWEGWSQYMKIFWFYKFLKWLDNWVSNISCNYCQTVTFGVWRLAKWYLATNITLKEQIVGHAQISKFSIENFQIWTCPKNLLIMGSFQIDPVVIRLKCMLCFFIPIFSIQTNSRQWQIHLWSRIFIRCDIENTTYESCS